MEFEDKRFWSGMKYQSKVQHYFRHSSFFDMNYALCGRNADSRRLAKKDDAPKCLACVAKIGPSFRDTKKPPENEGG